MKYIIFLILTWVSAAWLSAQPNINLTRSVIGSAGKSESHASQSYNLSFTLGEALIQTQYLMSTSLHQGFWYHQSTNIPYVQNRESMQNMRRIHVNQIKVNVYPNPTSDYLHLESDSSIKKVLLHDIHGQQILNLGTPQPSIDLSFLSSGVYYLKVFVGRQRRLTSFRIIKQ